MAAWTQNRIKAQSLYDRITKDPDYKFIMGTDEKKRENKSINTSWLIGYKMYVGFLVKMGATDAEYSDVLAQEKDYFDTLSKARAKLDPVSEARYWDK